MPKKMDECVKKVKKQDFPEKSAWPICVSSMKRKTKKSFDDLISGVIKNNSSVVKSLGEKINSFSKAIVVNRDTRDFTDTNSVNLARLSNPKSYQSYIEKYTEELEQNGNPVVIPLKNDNILKLYKVEEGLYSGHIQGKETGDISHTIDKVTLPELVSHLVVTENIPLIEDTNKKENDDSSKNIIINVNVNKSKEKSMDSLDQKIETFYKGKVLPIGSVSHGRKKVAEGRWVNVEAKKPGKVLSFSEGKKGLEIKAKEHNRAMDHHFKNAIKHERYGKKYAEHGDNITSFYHEEIAKRHHSMAKKHANAIGKKYGEEKSKSYDKHKNTFLEGSPSTHAFIKESNNRKISSKKIDSLLSGFKASAALDRQKQNKNRMKPYLVRDNKEKMAS